MQKRHSNRQQYFQELSYTSEKYLIPFIETLYPVKPQCRVLEIGCGEGGNLEPFVKRGCCVTGIDLSEMRIKEARTFFESYPRQQADFIAADIFTMKDRDASYDLIVVHDVIEHIPSQKPFLKLIGKLLKPGGIVFMGFPAWQMPFGGHQQICHNKLLAHLPYFHLLPQAMYKSLLKWGKEPENGIQELLSIKACGISIEKFRAYTRETGLTIQKEEFYFINPHYEIKFGLKPRKLFPAIGKIPGFRNFFTTSCFYLLQKKTNESPEGRVQED